MLMMMPMMLLNSLNRAALHELEKDTADKFVTLNLDNVAHQFRNSSRGIHYQDGIERVDNTLAQLFFIRFRSSFTFPV